MTMRSLLSLAACLVILAAAPSPSRASDNLNFSGYLNFFDYIDHSGLLGAMKITDHHRAPRNLMLQDRAGVRLQLRLDGRIGSHVSYDASINFEYDGLRALRQPTSGPADGFAVFPKEAYIDLTRLGPVGRSDHPYLTPPARVSEPGNPVSTRSESSILVVEG